MLKIIVAAALVVAIGTFRAIAGIMLTRAAFLAFIGLPSAAAMASSHKSHP